MQSYFESVTPPIYSADFHYFRIPREKWELMLTRLTQMGLNVITLTAPWGFHEFNQDTVDLTGTTNARRNLVGVLELCTALNLHCLLKPGPYSPHAGVLENGLPPWLSSESINFNTTLSAAAKRWYQALSKALVTYQWPNGPIIALQIEDESGREQPSTYSQELTEVRWPIWLRKRYQGIDALNAAYGTTYATVSEVPFPQNLSQAPAPLQEDAKTFLAEVKADTQSDYGHILVESGWQVPIYSSTQEALPQLPRLQAHSLAEAQAWPSLESDNALLTLQHPIQVDPDPPDVGRNPVWANNAPIRVDGSVRSSFWRVRQHLWLLQLPEGKVDADTLTTTLTGGGLITSAQDVPLKISLGKGAKPIAYRLRLTGELLIDDNLKVARNKLSGPYRTEDDTAQTDLILYRNDPTAPLEGFLLTYLQTLLNTQTQTLGRCATLCTELGQRLTQASPGESAPVPPSQPTSYTLAEARRGLSEADRILRKALVSIGGLEAGFDVMLGKSSPDVPEPAAAPAPISPEIFEGSARDILIEAGKVCREIAPHLKSAAGNLQGALDSPQGLTIDQYRQNYTNAVTVAQSARESLLEVISRLRVEMVSEKLPLVAWRVHNQIQEITESLRWGVLRG